MLQVAHFFDAPKGLQLPKVLQLFLDAAVNAAALVLRPSAPPLRLGMNRISRRFSRKLFPSRVVNRSGISTIEPEMHAKDCYHALPGAAS
jgi:hypothetical protein